MSLSDATLHAWLAGALEPPRALVVEEALRTDPAIQARLAGLRLELAVDTRDPWHIPPPGIPGGRGAFGMAPHQAAVFGGPLRPGDRFELRMDALADAADRFVIVLRKLAEGWTVVFPTDPEDHLLLADLPETEGSRVLELSAGDEPGLQRWAVALPGLQRSVDWARAEAERWTDIMEAVMSGAVPVASAEVQVETP